MEVIRRAVRGILRPDSCLYRSGANVLNFLSTMRTDGYRTWCTLKDLREENQSNPLQRSVSLRNLTYPILTRPGTEDAGTIINTVIREEYGHVTPKAPPKWMIDAGAYIGDTSAYFLSKYPDLKVIALEPNPPLDLLIIDLKMPEMNGLELIKAIRKVKPGFPAVLITAYRDESIQN